MARVTVLYTHFLKRARECGYTDITKTKLRDVPAKRLWNICTRGYPSGSLAALFQELSSLRPCIPPDYLSPRIVNTKSTCSHGVKWATCPTCGREGWPTEVAPGVCPVCQ